MPSLAIATLLTFALFPGWPLAAQEEDLSGADQPYETISLSKIVLTNPDYEYHEVRPGDYLLKILKFQGLLESDLDLTQLIELVAKLNPDIKDLNRLSVGQILKLPATGSMPPQPSNTETVKVFERNQTNQSPTQVQVLRHRNPVPGRQIPAKEIFIVDGKKEGLERTFYDNGVIKSEMSYKNGQPEGLAKEYYESGALSSETPYHNGHKEGLNKIYNERGTLISEMPYQAGQLDGLEKSYLDNGVLHREANYKNGKKEGLLKTYYDNGALEYEAIYQDDKLEGVAKTYYKNGMLQAETPFRNGEREGIAKTFYESGALEGEQRYQAGHPLYAVGLDKTYYENGSVKSEETPCQPNCLTTSYYDESGTLELEEHFQHGQGLVLVKEFYKGGHIKSETPFKDCQRSGLSKSYFENGNLRHEAIYEHGELEGPAKLYYENGAVKAKFTFTHHSKEGQAELFRENGRLLATIEFQADNPVKGLGRSGDSIEEPLSQAEMLGYLESLDIPAPPGVPSWDEICR